MAAGATRTFVDELSELGWPGGVPLDDATSLRLRDAWRRRYSTGLTDDQRRRWGGLEWHAFGSGPIPFAERDTALAAYAAQGGPVVVIAGWVPRLGDATLEGARFAAPPPMPPRHIHMRLHPDLLIFPESLAWTFAVTHEWGWCGPYFAPFVAPPKEPRRPRKRNGSRR